ncbi:putative N-acetyltransferase YhbS [Deinobacterium chartae]|uniref:Putative N-acetyltransferase YhbS n=1 Tax=Deinobacterium chartae TaxID=521158 RepID=A0A841I1M4_9DEIO|nr:DUF1999 domain-containing protein [Deinobacterium chartae]MBB6099143.1 putative N-acetyltransferase YhbS [Deinobacterium chartae]
MLYRVFNENDYDDLRALDLEVLRFETPGFDALPEREREGRTRTSLAALRFFERSEHSFVAEQDGLLAGAIFAQSVWQGDRPIVLVSRLWVRPGLQDQDPAVALEVARGLLKVCSKSAYDAAIYELHLAVPDELQAAAALEEFRTPGRYAVRYLGSRSETAPGSRLSGE